MSSLGDIWLDAAAVPWAEAESRAFLAPMMAEGSTAYVQNATCRMGIVAVDGVQLPFTVSDYLPNNSYICSPYNHYVTYAGEELSHLGNPPAEWLATQILHGMGRLLNPPHFDRVVYVNNWLLSTNLYPAMPPTTATTMLKTLVAHFPDHAISFRSLDRFRNPALVDELVAAGCETVFSRRIWYQEARSAAVQRSRDFKQDVKMLRRSPYEVVRVAGMLSDSEIERVVHLYNQLYLEKYSYHNPQFTPRWVQLMLAQGLMHFTLLVREGRIDGVYGYVVRNGVMAQPFLGYDTTLPQEAGLYRLLSALILLEAERMDYLCHASSGVGRFKKLRGGIGVEEYNVIYLHHLPAARQRPWRLLRWVLDTIAVPVIQKGGY